MKVIVHQEPHAEDNAALQAWYSRSNKSVTEHREKLAKEGSGKFMDRIFIQYGHESVGDLGTTTVYFEGVSMLAAKALEDTPLFNGQECSSRYIDFGSVEFRAGKYGKFEDRVFRAQDEMRKFYVQSLPRLVGVLKSQHPHDGLVTETVYNKAIQARAFDILRGFLPCGATTNVAWSGTLRTFKERLELLMHHPLHEVYFAAAWAYACLHEKYPNSFRADYAAVFKTYQNLGKGREALREIEKPEVYEHYCKVSQFYSDVSGGAPLSMDEMFVDISGEGYIITSGFLEERLAGQREVTDAIYAHPRKTRPARHGSFAHSTLLDIHEPIDFGSFRDLQRHRGGYCSMPAVDLGMGFHPWYLDNLVDHDLVNDATHLISQIRDLDDDIMNDCIQAGCDNTGVFSTQQRLENQYFMPMGAVVPAYLNYSVHQAIYVAELRSGQSVHPTLRPLAQKIAKELQRHGIEVHYDSRPDVWTTVRGNQDIVEKP